MTTLPGEGSLLRIFIGESDRHAGMLLYEWIVRTAREHGLAGATVLRGVEGFGARSRVRTAKILELSTDLPIIVEIVDRAEKIEPSTSHRWRDCRRAGDSGEGANQVLSKRAGVTNRRMEFQISSCPVQWLFLIGCDIYRH